MRKMLWLGLLALGLGSAAMGCTVRETVVARPVTAPPACRGGVWIDGRYGPRGRWHPGHWRCPGVVERIEIY